MKEKIEILLVEDTPSDVRLTEEALKRSDLTYNLITVHDGEQACDYLNKAKTEKTLPDVILLDLNMPKKNGHEVLAEIKQDEELKKIPVVLLTVSQRDEDVNEALRLKMNYYIAKPVTAVKLSALLTSIYTLEHELKQKEGASNDEVLIRLVLAGNPHTSEAVIIQLAVDPDERVRRRVAENPNTPASVLKTLAADASADVRLAASENANLPEAALEALAHDPDDDVRLGLSMNNKIPVAILEGLSADENVYVSSNATKTLAELTQSKIKS
ncbi:MAG: response regulator [Candidatus Melainabacteria bacterium]|nr:response regulator [Candidatus Melainabacteria bacterium]